VIIPAAPRSDAALHRVATNTVRALPESPPFSRLDVCSGHFIPHERQDTDVIDTISLFTPALPWEKSA
jgi:hypothetical protein